MLNDTPVCNFGWKAPDFELATPDGSRHRMSDHIKNALLIAFICNHCPYVIRIAARLAEDAHVLKQNGVNVLAIMSNDYQNYPADAPKYMLQFASRYGFNFPYLVDEDQSVARSYDAVCTPDFFGLNANGELQYRGRLDDAGMGDPNNRKPDLLDAMLQIAQTGVGPKEQVASMGCSIKWR
ncbi:MAG: thioredoxin family protein [Aestuariivita sp.]|nr:thioredoxin family protein [Aestuariivita sp.]MCY4203787.1 thioredoxin family protein [Aestuariivita sp.]MCY4289133.1 thioredoxin family protein [Aestuariivita sp.]MCY4347733.1 thioredoxin family protein [Aestuariivita sp.]